MDVVGLYPNIPHGEGPALLCNFFKTRNNKQILIDTLTEFVEIVVKSNISEFDEKTLNLMKKFVFDKCCNGLQKWLMERGYNKKMIRK